MSTLKGKAAVFGLNGDLAYTGVATPSNQLLSGAEVTHNYAKAELVDPATNEVVGEALSREVLEVSIDFTPVADPAGNTLTNARAALKLPAMNAVVALTAFDDSDYNHTFNYVGGGRISFSPDGYCKMTLPLRRYVAGGDTLVTALATTVS